MRVSAPRTAQPVGRLREQKDTCWDGILTGQRLSSASPALTSVHFPQPASAPLPQGEPEGEGSALCRSLSLLSKGPVWGVTRSSPDWSLPWSTLTSGCPPPTCVFLTLGVKRDNKHTFVQGGGVGACSPMQGRVGWTFPEREPGLALAPGALVTPHPSLLQRAAKASSGQDYVYWVDHGEAAGTDLGEQREAEGGEQGTSIIGEETGCVHHPFQPKAGR